MSRLHWYGPRSRRPGEGFGTAPLRRARYKLYIPDEHYAPASTRYGRDKHGAWTWMGTDCGWEWLATRPGIYGRPWAEPFWKLHEHVHTPGSW